MSEIVKAEGDLQQLYQADATNHHLIPKNWCVRHHQGFHGSCGMCLYEMIVNLLEIIAKQKQTKFTDAQPKQRRYYDGTPQAPQS